VFLESEASTIVVTLSLTNEGVGFSKTVPWVSYLQQFACINDGTKVLCARFIFHVLSATFADYRHQQNVSWTLVSV